MTSIPYRKSTLADGSFYIMYLNLVSLYSFRFLSMSYNDDRI